MAPLLQHLYQPSRPATMKRFSCSHPGCSKEFKRRDYLSRHESNHSTVRPFACDVCSVAFARKDLLDKHKRSKTHVQALVEDDPVPRKKQKVPTPEPFIASDPALEVDRLAHVTNVMEDSLGWLFGPDNLDAPLKIADSRHGFDLAEFEILTATPSAAPEEPYHMDFSLSDDTFDEILSFLRDEGIEVDAHFSIKRIDFFLSQYWGTLGQIAPIIHRDTFDVNAYEKTNLNITFLLSLITIGIMSSNNTAPNEKTLALRIQKKLRHHLYVVMDQCDLSFIPLKLLQALLLNDIFHMYYGDPDQRKSFKIYHTVTINILKEMKLTKNLKEPFVDPNNFNYASWLQWIRYESLKRISFLAMVVDSQSTFFFGMSPSISIFDMQLELPYSDSVWLARTTEEFTQEYKKLPRDMIDREKALDVDIQSQSCRYEDVFANGNLIPNVKSESHWPSFLWSLRRLLQTHGNVTLNDREYHFDCFSLFGRVILLHGLMFLVRCLRSTSSSLDVGSAAKVEHGFISWRTYLHFHASGRATLNNYYNSSTMLWFNIITLHSSLMGLYCNFDMVQHYLSSSVKKDISWNDSPSRLRYDAIEVTKNKFLIHVWRKSKDGEYAVVQACVILKTVFNEEDLIVKLPQLAYTAHLAAIVCWVYFYQDDEVPLGSTADVTKLNALEFVTSALAKTPTTHLLQSMLNYTHLVLSKYTLDDTMLKELSLIAQTL